MQTLRDQACIVGVGETAYTHGAQKSVLRLVLEASRHAITDAGVTTHDIEEFVLPGPYPFQEQLAANFSINDLRYSTYIQMGGASPVTAQSPCHVAKISKESFISSVNSTSYASNVIRTVAPGATCRARAVLLAVRSTGVGSAPVARAGYLAGQ